MAAEMPSTLPPRPSATINASPLHQRLAQFLQTRQPPKTFCPSEVARALTTSERESLGYQDWREAMSAIRELAWQFRDRGECEILQRGEPLGVDIGVDQVKGPIRIRRVSLS